MGTGITAMGELLADLTALMSSSVSVTVYTRFPVPNLLCTACTFTWLKNEPK